MSEIEVGRFILEAGLAAYLVWWATRKLNNDLDEIKKALKTIADKM